MRRRLSILRVVSSVLLLVLSGDCPAGAGRTLDIFERALYIRALLQKGLFFGVFSAALRKRLVLCLLSDIYVYIYESFLQQIVFFCLLSDIYVYVYKSLLQMRLLFCLLSDVQGSFQKNLSHNLFFSLLTDTY